MCDDELIKSTDFETSDISKKDINSATNFSSNFFEWLESISQVLIVLTIIFSFIFFHTRVEGSSMENTLHDNERLIIWRWGYVPKNNDIVVGRGRYVDIPIIKRVIATEGQTFNIDYSSGVGVVTVDGVTLNELYIKEPMVLSEAVSKLGLTQLPVVIPEGYSFVMGDNRNNSTDSRDQIIGLMANKDIVGKAVYRFYPFDVVGKL